MSENQEKSNQGIDQMKDHFLAEIVNSANTVGLRLPITLNVSGVMVSGNLISGKQYFEKSSDLCAKASSGDEKFTTDLRSFISSFGKVYDAAPPTTLDELVFIHLDDAQFHAPNQARRPNGGGALWRGKLAAVDGFFLGWSVVKTDNA